MVNIGIDLDNTINKWGPMLKKRVEEDFGKPYTLQEIYQRYRLRDALKLSAWEEFLFWQKHGLDIVMKSPPQTYCRSVLRLLVKRGFKIHIVTSRPLLMRQITLTWLSNHHIPYHKIHFGVTRKAEECSKLGVQYMIEDANHHITDLIEHGIVTLAVNYPYNAHLQHQNLIHVRDWKEIYHVLFLLKKKHN